METKNMKKLFIILYISFFIPFAATALKMNGKHYQGIAKNADTGEPIEFWVDVEFDDEDVTVDIGKVYNFMAPYKVTGEDKSATISTKMPGFNVPITFKTNDGGSTLTADFKEPNKGMKLNLWLLKVPRKLKKAQLPQDELMETVTSSDGYTCFMEIKRGDSVFCVTADAFLYPDGSFKVIQDAQRLSELFKDQLDGSFRIEGAEILLNLSGIEYHGEIYDNGNYVKIPVGSLGSSNSNTKVTLNLIR